MHFNLKAWEFVESMLRNFDCCIAGGFPLHVKMETDLTSRQGDIDFFFSSEEEYKKAIDFANIFFKKDLDLSQRDLGEQFYFGESVRAYTVGGHNQIWQLIKTKFGTVEEILGQFDFDNCKVAIYRDKYGTYEMAYSELVPHLIGTKKLSYKRNLYIAENSTQVEKKKLAKNNIQRLGKYLSKFPAGFCDDDSRTEFLQQLAWDFLQTKTSYCSPQIEKILLDENTPMEDLILFFPLGIGFKKIFDIRTGRAEKIKQPKHLLSFF